MKKWERPKCKNLYLNQTELCGRNYFMWTCNVDPSHCGVGQKKAGDPCPVDGCSGLIISCEYPSNS